MKDHYNFGTMKSRKNPFANKLKKQITIRIATDTLEYFREMVSAGTQNVPPEGHLLTFKMYHLNTSNLVYLLFILNEGGDSGECVEDGQDSPFTRSFSPWLVEPGD